MNRKPYPSDVSDEEWAFVAPYQTLMDEDAPQRTYPLREVFNALRWCVDHVPAWFIADHRKEPTGRPRGRPKGAKDSYKRAPYRTTAVPPQVAAQHESTSTYLARIIHDRPGRVVWSHASLLADSTPVTVRWKRRWWGGR